MNNDDLLRDEELDGVSGGMYPATDNGSSATVPNVCMVPGPPAPFVPAPSSGGTASATGKKVLGVADAVAVKGAQFSMSRGDEAGTLKELLT